MNQHAKLLSILFSLTIYLSGNSVDAKVIHPIYFVDQYGAYTCWAAGATTMSDYYSYPFKNPFSNEWTYYYQNGGESCGNNEFSMDRRIAHADGVSETLISTCGTRFCTILGKNPEVNNSSEDCCSTGGCMDSGSIQGSLLYRVTGLEHNMVSWLCDNDSCPHYREISQKIRYEIDRNRPIILEHPQGGVSGHINIVYGYDYDGDDFLVYVFDTGGYFIFTELQNWYDTKLNGYADFYFPECNDQSLSSYPSGTSNHVVKGCFISAQNDYTISSGKSAVFEAKVQIKLKPGFKAYRGSHFTARINPALTP